MSYQINTGVKNSSFTASPTRFPIATPQMRLSGFGGSVIPPNPINPFSSPSGFKPTSYTFPGLFNAPTTLNLETGELQTDYNADILKPFRDEISKHQVDFVVALIGIVLMIAAIVQIAKPL